jgi:hypothetical protein
MIWSNVEKPRLATPSLRNVEITKPCRKLYLPSRMSSCSITSRFTNDVGSRNYDQVENDCTVDGSTIPSNVREMNEAAREAVEQRRENRKPAILRRSIQAVAARVPNSFALICDYIFEDCLSNSAHSILANDKSFGPARSLGRETGRCYSPNERLPESCRGIAQKDSEHEPGRCSRKQAT